MSIADTVRRLMRSKRAERRERSDALDDQQAEAFLEAIRGHRVIRKPPPGG